MGLGFRTLFLSLGVTLSMACSAANERALGNESGGSAGMAGMGAGGSSASGGSGGVTIQGGSGGAAGAPAECRNVDILFVIDRSGSMADNQISLINSFPGFIGAIQQKLQFADSYHVGVVSSDDNFENAPGCQKIGDLVTQTGGPLSSQAMCGPFASGKRYLDEKEPNIAGKFACVAQVGSGGNDDERVARAMLNAVKTENNAPGACNAGFARLDSLLIVVLITDEDDAPDECGTPDPFSPCGCKTCGSGGDPDAWYQELLSYKGGIKENIVVLSLIGLKANNACGAVPASTLIGFTNKFGANAYKGDVCAASYDGFFAETLPVIDQACEKYVPPPVK